MSRKDLAAALRLRLLASVFHKRLGTEGIEFVEPFVSVGNERFEQNATVDSADADFVAFESEFAGKSDGLAAAVLKELGDFGHGGL